MDDCRFDQLTRSIANATNRREFLRRLLGVGGAAVGALALRSRQTEAARRGFSGPCRPAGTFCAANAQCCTNFCMANLGPGGTCAICDARICGDFVCADLQWDPRNCGSCGNVCGAGTTCNMGTCRAGDV
jgi:hypothetical protein